MLACGHKALRAGGRRVSGLRAWWWRWGGGLGALSRLREGPRLQLKLEAGPGVGWGGSGGPVLGTEGAPPSGLESGFFAYLSLSSLLTEESRLSTSLSLS